MNILEETQSYFAVSSRNTAIPLSSIGTEYPAWVIRYEGWYGVGIPVSKDLLISEQFSNAKLHTREMVIEGIEYNLLMLVSIVEELRIEFSVVCAQFVDPGKNGIYRKELTEDPVQWWEKWRSLLGNSIQDKPTYSVLGELLVYDYLLSMGLEPKWTGAEGSSHDIELNNESYEVKSTISRYESTVMINGQFQLLNRGKELNLIFCRFEPSYTGFSINSLLKQIDVNGGDTDKINLHLAKIGLEIGSSARSEKFKLLEMRKYLIDENFPSITPESFKQNKIPESILQIIYKVDLTNIKYENISAAVSEHDH